MQWRGNEECRPSPSARGWPPTDEIDEAVQLAVTGCGPAGEATWLAAGAGVAVRGGPEDDVRLQGPGGCPKGQSGHREDGNSWAVG
ncbi:hypothetical protein ABZX30_25150 [Streptomyces sp. NPDC004542]|uniref:hypothetical protein n=1 Tax=Streptomyces sp. NPDC004542 TaxID=3154281 RepID=UPI0033B289E0